jgi:hypothetical protein
VDVAVDQSRNQVLVPGIDDPGALGNRAFARGTGAQDAVTAHDGDGVGHGGAAGTVPEGGADDGSGRIDGWRCDQLGGWRATGGGR